MKKNHRIAILAVCLIIAGVATYLFIPKPPAIGTAARLKWELRRVEPTATIKQTDGGTLMVEYVSGYPDRTECEDIRNSQWYLEESEHIIDIIRRIGKSGYSFSGVYISGNGHVPKRNQETTFILAKASQIQASDENYLRRTDEVVDIGYGVLIYCCCDFGEALLRDEGTGPDQTCEIPWTIECVDR